MFVLTNLRKYWWNLIFFSRIQKVSDDYWLIKILLLPLDSDEMHSNFFNNELISVELYMPYNLNAPSDVVTTFSLHSFSVVNVSFLYKDATGKPVLKG